MDAMSQVDFLMNFGTADYHLPSKVVDYLYVQKPIVNFTALETDSTQMFFRDYEDILNLRLEEKNFTALSEGFLAFVFKQREAQSISPLAMEDFGKKYILSLYKEQISI